MSRINVARLAVPTASILAAAALAGCGASNSGTSGSPLAPQASTGSVVVGSDDFAESVLLADIYGQALAAKGIKVSYKLNIGSREVTYNLVKSGVITLKPEYNGALLSYLDSGASQSSASVVDTEITSHLAPGMKILAPSDAQDNDTLTLSKQEADTLGLKQGATISQFLEKLGNRHVTIGASPEFQTQGLNWLEQTYGLKASQATFVPLDAGGPLTERALTSGQVNAGDLFTTDPTIGQSGLLTLVDDKDIFGLQDVLPLIHQAGLSQSGVDALDAVDAKLDTTALRKMDTEVQVNNQDPLNVANDWLRSVGLG